jgi:glycyl-tRNA synthetase
MDELVALCKRRGFVYPASEIYGGINGFWDYGPLGVQLKNNIRDSWWRAMVECPPIGPDGRPIQIVGLDSAIIQNPKTWEASGHVAGFNDPMVEDKGNGRFRADHLQGLYLCNQEIQTDADAERANVIMDSVADGTPLPDRTVVASNPQEAAAILEGDKKLRKILGIKSFNQSVTDEPDGTIVVLVDFGQGQKIAHIAPVSFSSLESASGKIPSPYTGKPGTLTEPRQFNLMFDSHAGAVRDEASKVYLRPETAQGIFLNYKNVLDTMRVKIPFGVAQVGKAFRNEVTPRNFIFRSREFEQMEMEWFCHPDEAETWYEFWKAQRMAWWESLGISKENLRFRDHEADELSHYSRMCVDVEYRWPFTAPDFGELEGIAHRGCFDLTQHQEHSGAKMEYLDTERRDAGEAEEKWKYIPNVIEPASGLTRGLLVVLCEAFTPTPDRKGSKYVMKFAPSLAPIKAGIFPLVAKDGMPEIAQPLYEKIRKRFTCEYDVKQSIGKRYARMDEVGTPFCFTIDGQTKEDRTVTVRDRDTAEQFRINIDQVETFLAEKIEG